MANALIVDPEISRRKFEREIDQWSKLAVEHGRSGIFVTEVRFPNVFAVLAAAHLSPRTVVFGVQLNFDNYDLWPPSVRFLDPFTREPYTRANLPQFYRVQPLPPGTILPPGAQVPVAMPVMFQDPQGDGGEAFFCVQGVREYHVHPAHTGDPWTSYRGSGKGTLVHILDKLHEFGITILKGHAMAMQLQIQGYQIGF